MRSFILLLILLTLGFGAYVMHRDGQLFGVSGKYFGLSGSASSTLFMAKEEDTTGVKKSNSSSVDDAPATVSSKEVDEKVTKVIKELDDKGVDARTLELRSPASPYAGMVTLKVGNAKVNDVQKEYVILAADKSLTTPLNITGWHLVSYVTDSKATIPEGAEFLKTHSSTKEDSIYLKAGEQAFVVTGETPVKTSFRENVCTGYLSEYGSFSPTLKQNCPMPADELLQFSSVKASDNNCAEFVNDIKKCEIISDDELNTSHLSSSCESFVRQILDYEGCVSKHNDPPGFYTGGDWRIYLDKRRELWRSAKDIIRLTDANDKVVAVLEY